MCSYKPVVLLWLRRTQRADQIARIREILSSLSGVLGVISSLRNPQLVLIRYDQQQISSQHLLRVALDHDQTARLVGI